MFYEPSKGNHGLRHDPLLAVVSPRPIGWISTLSAGGIVNLAPYSYFNIFSRRPALVGFSSNSRKHTLVNIEATGEFVCNVATWALIDAVNQTSAELPADESELAFAGLAAAPCQYVKPPRVAASPCALECKWIETMVLKDLRGRPSDNFLVLGEVVGVYIEDRFIAEGFLDITRTRHLSRCGYLDYSSVESLQSLPRPEVNKAQAGDQRGDALRSNSLVEASRR